MKKGDLVYVDYIDGRKYLLIKKSVFLHNTACYLLIDPKTGKTDYLWKHQIKLAHAS